MIDPNPSLLKPLLQAIATLVALQGERDAGRLDAAALELVQQAEETLAAKSGRTVMTAWLRWNAGGRLSRDPRGAPVRVLGAEVSQRPDHGGRRGGPGLHEGAG